MNALHSTSTLKLDSKSWSKLLPSVVLILIATALRILPHLPNFSPITAIALFGAASIDRKYLAVLVPLAALFLSDCVLGFHALMPAVYISFLLISMLGFWLRQDRSPVRVGLTAFIGSCLFFLITNFAVWLQGDLYAKTWLGFVQCYTMALPFFHNSLAGDLIITFVLFGAWSLVERSLPVAAREGMSRGR